MMVHYHGTPITPNSVFEELAGKSFCVSHAHPGQIRKAHELGQSVMLDNGAFSQWKTGKPTNWPRYYTWAEEWLAYPTSWAVPPDIIGAPAEDQDRLLSQWPHSKKQSAPVWHLNEPVYRLLSLIDQGWSRVCFGSTIEYGRPLTAAWQRRMDEAWCAISFTFSATPATHMLRGMACSGKRWPFASVDSTDVARNHNRPQNTARSMADRWDAKQCPSRWKMEE